MMPKMLFLTVFILNSCASQKLNPTLKTSDWEVILIGATSSLLVIGIIAALFTFYLNTKALKDVLRGADA